MDGIRVRSNGTSLTVLAVALVLLLVSRLPISPSTLSLDNVNFAFAIQHFDPWMHQPQPPGYPFFVAESRLVNSFFHDAQTSFLFISTVVTWLSVGLLFALGRRMFGAAAGTIGALLLIFNPTMWYSGLESPLRPHLAFFSLLVAYLCYRMWKGEAYWGLWAAVALGVGSGFRPDLLVYLFPLWCISMWKSRNSRQNWIKGIGIIFGLTAVWLGVAAYAVGGLDRYALLMWVYSFSAMSDTASVLVRISVHDWVYHFIHMVAWNSAGVLSWVWMLPLWLFARKRQKGSASRVVFFIAWVVPGMLAQALLHVAAPGHTLFSIVAFCLIGAHVIVSTCEGLSARFASQFEIVSVGGAVLLNTLLFFNVLPFPALPQSAFVYPAFLEGLRQTTFDELQSSNQLSESSVRELRDLVRGDRPAVIVSTEGSSQYFRFLNSRIASYYIGDRDFWIVVDEQDPPRASRIRGKDILEIRYGSIVKVPVPQRARIIWLMDPASPFRNAVSQAVSLKHNGNLFHSDLAPNLSGFRVKNFEFVIQTEGKGDGVVVGNRTSAIVESGQN